MPTREELSRQKLLAAAASYNLANNPQALSTLARGQRGAAIAAAPVEPQFQGPGVQGTELAARTLPPLPFAQQKPQPLSQPTSRMVKVGYSQGPGPAEMVQTNLTRGPNRPVVGESVQNLAAVTGAGGGGIIPAAEARPVRTNAAVTPPPGAPVAPTAPLSQPVTTRAPAYDVQRNYGGQQGITRVVNRDTPGEAPLFTNNPSAAAAYNEMGGPGLTPPNGNPDARAASGNPVGYGGPLAAPVVGVDAQGRQFTRTPGDTNAPLAEAPGGGGTFSVAPGLFSGVSTATDQALSDARFAAAKRGDFAAVDNSYRTPAEKDAFTAQQAQNKILRNVGNAPANQLPQVLQAVGGLQGQAQESALAEQKLQTGAIDLSNKENVQGALDALLNADPKDPVARQQAQTVLQAILSAQPGYKQPAVAQPFTSADVPTGELDELGQPITAPRPFDRRTGTYGPPLQQQSGAQQVAAPPAAIAKLQQNPQLAADFKQKYGYLPAGF
ncbi:hypothetical protein BH20PSE1_BH20PSE1_00890 [soil metagenome]